MQVMLEIIATVSELIDQSAYRVTVSQGEDQITSEEELLREVGTHMHKKGIVAVNQISNKIWIVYTSK